MLAGIFGVVFVLAFFVVFWLRARTPAQKSGQVRDFDMRILITGAAGMVGRKLIARLAKDGTLRGKKITALDLHDIVPPQAPGHGRRQHHTPIPATWPRQVPPRAWSRRGPMSSSISPASCRARRRPISISATASISTARAPCSMPSGWRRFAPRVVFTSSIAVFGAPFPDVIPDEFHPTPLTSYGTQKQMSEALLADYSRRGFFDGIGIRLPTICVRPGKPNKAASGFFSGIIREPLSGQEAILPVPRSVVHTHASPRSAVNFLIHAAGIDGAAVGPRRNLTMPGVAVTVGEQIEALERIAGAEGREADPRGAGRDDLGDRQGLADPLRGAAVAGARLQRREEFRRDHPRPYRG